MQVLIVAKTRQGGGACIGGITSAGRSVRLLAFDAATNEQAGLEYEVGEVWEIVADPPAEILPPHVENIIVRRKRRLRRTPDLAAAIHRLMPPQPGGVDLLFDGLTRATRTGALYICQQGGVPAYSTGFWQPDQPLRRDDDAKRIRYRYPTPDGGRTLTFVGFQEPVEELPAGALLRVSLAHWWRPPERPDGELRCFVQLSGWIDDLGGGAAASAPASAHVRGGAPLPVGHPARRLLKEVFGFERFLPWQEEIIANILAGRDTLAIMPTGGGKSLCFQLPALLFEGLTLVVSPLIALMQDQVDALRQVGAPAAFLNSALDYSAYLAVMHRVRTGEIKLLYTSPETLLRPETLLLLEQAQLACLVIDEAHCISAWGHDFRPEYRQLLPLRTRFPGAVCLALTATATPRVREDIAGQLGFGAANTFIASFNRTNLFLAVQRRQGPQQVLDFLQARPQQSGIIYCSTREQVDNLAAFLQARGFPALPYHAGMETAERLRNQRRFSTDDAPIIVATIAFGMGIDKSNVRFILHYNLPKNIESYYQEIGRSGRDGLPADCLLLFSRQDISTILHFIAQGADSEQAGARARLDALLRYVDASDCRRRPLLAYFGETFAAASCGMCDNCLAADAAPAGEPAPGSEAAGSEDVTLPAQKFLSCILRTGQMFGVEHIIKVLRGSRDKAVLGRGHEKLSTYGIGQEFSTDSWRRLAHAFIAQGLLSQDAMHGSLRLTEKGRRVLKGEPFRLALAAAPSSSARGAETYDLLLFEKLRALRKRCADEAGVPPYVIFSDRSLAEMATYYPHTPSSFLAIHGVGQRKWQSYGQDFLALIRQHCAAHGLQERARPALEPAAPIALSGKKRFQEVGELFAAGRSIAELQTLYNVKQGTILAHLYTYLRSGQSVDAQRVLAVCTLPAAEQARVLALFAEMGDERLSALFDALGGAITYDDLHLLRLAYASSSR